MATPAQTTPLRLAASAGSVREAGPGEPVPVAFLGRTSTLEMQDPRASLRRQIRAAQAWLPPGWFITAWYWDIESGGLDLEARGHGQAWRAVRRGHPPRRRHGRPARRGRVPGPEVRRRGLRGHRAVRPGHLQRAETGEEAVPAGIPLFATDEPAVIEGVNATTVLVRRMKQGVAEWFRLQLKEKTWKGLVEHALDGWNIGPAPYGYAADRIPHPVPAKASQGRTKTRLALDPARAPVVEQIFTWRVVRQARHAHHRRPAQRRPGPLPRPHRRRAGPPRPSTPCWATPSTPGTWSTAGSANATAAASPSPSPSGCGHPSRSTPPSWTGTPGTPPRTSAPSIRPAGTATG